MAFCTVQEGFSDEPGLPGAERYVDFKSWHLHIDTTEVSTYGYFGDSSWHLYVDTSDALTIRSSRCRTTTGPEHTSLLFRRGGHFPPAWLLRSHRSPSVPPTRRAMRVSSCLGGTEHSLRYAAPMRTGRQGITLDILLCHDGARSWMRLLGASAAAPPYMRQEQASPCVFCYRRWQPVGRRDRPRIGAVGPYVRVVSGVGDHSTGDRRCPAPVWEEGVQLSV
jgi:hypothetical protein